MIPRLAARNLFSRGKPRASGDDPATAEKIQEQIG